ncbi:unnamed protein product [Effrenium voratum]|uniref:Uncharacterized protein n=1 Tax=Effrenium voratum TaxID=2562239 RepID=A0AA36IMY1_9DINO|nr:unnamed protein product [Effrenium voratum]
MRSSRFEEGNVTGHAEYDVANKDFLVWLTTFEPKMQVFEQVMGFDLPFNTASSETPLQRFLDDLSQCRFKHGYWRVTLKMDMRIWQKVARPRPGRAAGVELVFCRSVVQA